MESDHLHHPLEPDHLHQEVKDHKISSKKHAEHHKKKKLVNSDHHQPVQTRIDQEKQTIELNIEEHRTEAHYKDARYMRRSLEKRPSLLDTKLVVEIKKNNP